MGFPVCVVRSKSGLFTVLVGHSGEIEFLVPTPLDLSTEGFLLGRFLCHKIKRLDFGSEF